MTTLWGKLDLCFRHEKTRKSLQNASPSIASKGILQSRYPYTKFQVVESGFGCKPWGSRICPPKHYTVDYQDACCGWTPPEKRGRGVLQSPENDLICSRSLQLIQHTNTERMNVRHQEVVWRWRTLTTALSLGLKENVLMLFCGKCFSWIELSSLKHKESDERNTGLRERFYSLKNKNIFWGGGHCRKKNQTSENCLIHKSKFYNTCFGFLINHRKKLVKIIYIMYHK